jgi:hypothetical protein
MRIVTGIDGDSREEKSKWLMKRIVGYNGGVYCVQRFVVGVRRRPAGNMLFSGFLFISDE